ncbi:lipase family protein [Nocardia sp. CDC159]|uniref:Lipase family protein n=1 Tax=Nocardia pulmonis TaxID=2951408 RepID=A0A9X2EEY8_9NOCA|nr:MULTISPECIES: lipase family protein [Nocardia]MCM6778200.1 lipase family protein [Nocardia pulmonis]MCM6791089.1 lipase family protein [Nocardia sp. CDC159]
MFARLERAAVLALGACLLVATATTAWADPDPQPPLPIPSERQILPAVIPLTPPDRDPWYDDPADLAELNNGDIVRARDVQSYVLGIPFPVHTRQILYRTTDAHDAPIVTATTVLVPGIPWLGSPRPLVSYQEAIDSTASICNPSYTLRAGLFKEIALTQYFLEQGMAVAIPDFNGKRNAWLSSSEGRMVLDGIRAAQRDPALGLRDSGVGLYGYSGGGNASASAAELHASYAPELRILGSAQGGVAADKAALFAGLQGPTTFYNVSAQWALWAIVAGLTKDYPDILKVDELLTPEGIAHLRNMDGRCVYSEVVTGLTGPPLTKYLKDPNVLQRPEIQQLLHDISFGSPERRPDIPIFMWHSMTDQLIPMNGILPVEQAYCRSGVNLRWFTIPASEHLSADVAVWPAATAWLSWVLRGGDPGPVLCQP